MVQASHLPQSADEIDVLHQRPLAIAADRLKRIPTDEQRLVAVREIEPTDSPSDGAFDDPRLPGVGVQPELKTTADDRWFAIGTSDCVEPPLRQVRIRVKEHEPPAARGPRPCIHLSPPARGARQESDIRVLVYDCGKSLVRRGSAYDDNLDVGVTRKEEKKP